MGPSGAFSRRRLQFHEPALDGVLDCRVGGAFLSGFFNGEPSAFDCVVTSPPQAACEGPTRTRSDATSSVQRASAAAPILQEQQQYCTYPCEKEPRAVSGVGPSTAIIADGGPCALQNRWLGRVLEDSDANSNVVAPHTIALPDKAVAIGGSNQESSCAVLANGQLACWLLGKDGPVDTGGCAATGCALPAIVPGLSNLVAVSIALDHGCVLRNDGAVFCWGGSLAGLGDGTGMTSVTPSASRRASAFRRSRAISGSPAA